MIFYLYLHFFYVCRLMPPKSAARRESFSDDNDDEYYDDNGKPYVPPCETDGKRVHYFGQNMANHFFIPARLRNKSSELIETVNDWHFAMINDRDRNNFYQCALRSVIDSNSVVLEIGAGSGLLSIMAAKAGAKSVVAIEANRELANLATQIILANGM